MLSGCAYQVEYEPDYLGPDAPGFVAEAEIVILMHPHDTEEVYIGSPTTAVGDFTTLTIPLGNIMQEISAEVFRSCFSQGVVFSRTLADGMGFILAIEPEIRDFSYGYERTVYEDSAEGTTRSITTPKVEFELHITTYDASREVTFESSYPSGEVYGESYEVTSRPYERVNETFHSALQGIMLQVAEDIRPLLVGQCRITDLAAGEPGS
jgi:hypothetical protein